jgi:hypothetical protein
MNTPARLIFAMYVHTYISALVNVKGLSQILNPMVHQVINNTYRL